MSGKNFTLIFYYVPEDKDDLGMPNAFGIKKSIDELRITDIKEQFPLEGQYHFRFKYKHGSDLVWLDLVNSNCKLPTFNGQIFMKVTRKSWSTNSKESSSVPQYSYTNGNDHTVKKSGLLDGLDSPATIPTPSPPPVGTMPLNNVRRTNIIGT